MPETVGNALQIYALARSKVLMELAKDRPTPHDTIELVNTYLSAFSEAMPQITLSISYEDEKGSLRKQKYVLGGTLFSQTVSPVSRP